MIAERTDTFATLRRVKMHPGMVVEYARLIKAHAVPLMRTIDGFRGYFVVAVTEDTAITVSLFANKAAAETCEQVLRPWFTNNIGPLLASRPEHTEGEVLVRETA